MKHQSLKAADELFTDFIKALAETVHLVELSAKGIYQLYSVGELINDYIHETGQNEDEDTLKRSKEEMDFAKSEAERGFPFLYGQGSVWIWGQLEAFIEDMLVTCMEKDVELTNNEMVRRIKLSLVQYESMSEKERKYYILDNLQRDLQAKFKQGVTQFEAILDVFKWGGKIDDQTRKDLFELGNIRNTLVHRRGIADKRLIESCPWLNMKVGDSIKVDAVSFNRYTKTIMLYVCLIIKRVTIYYGDKTDRIDKLIEGISNMRVHTHYN
jgi:hypothetical protein